MPLTIHPAGSKADLEAFLQVSYHICRNDPNYVYPLLSEVHHFFGFCEVDDDPEAAVALLESARDTTTPERDNFLLLRKEISNQQHIY